MSLCVKVSHLSALNYHCMLLNWWEMSAGLACFGGFFLFFIAPSDKTIYLPENTTEATYIYIQLVWVSGPWAFCFWAGSPAFPHSSALMWESVSNLYLYICIGGVEACFVCVISGDELDGLDVFLQVAWKRWERWSVFNGLAWYIGFWEQWNRFFLKGNLKSKHIFFFFF